jgi:hypothetical protein
MQLLRFIKHECHSVEDADRVDVHKLHRVEKEQVQ